MGFLDKAKAAANDLAAKADTALGNAGLGVPKPPGSGDADKYFHDLGVLTFLEASGRGADPGERARVMAALQELDAHGAVHSFNLHTAPPPAPGMAPPPPGAAAYPPAPGAGTYPPPPGAASVAAPPPPPGGAAPEPPAAPAAPVAPPPPPSWMTQGGDSNG